MFFGGGRLQVGRRRVAIWRVGRALLGLPCGVGDQADAAQVVAVEIADSLPRAACIGNPEIRVRLQDDLLVCPAEVTDFGGLP